MVNMLEAQKITAKLKAIAKVLNEASARRLKSLLEGNRGPKEDNPESRAYDKGFDDGLHAGLTVSKIELADLEIEDVAAAFDATEEC